MPTFGEFWNQMNFKELALIVLICFVIVAARENLFKFKRRNSK